MQPIIQRDGGMVAISLQELATLLDQIAFYSGRRVQVSFSGQDTNLPTALSLLETGKQGQISFYSGGVLQGTATEINATGGAGLSIAGNRATITSGATVSAQSFGSNLLLSTNPDQYLNLTATNPSLNVTLQQPASDAITNIYNAGAVPFSVVGNWEGDPFYTQTALLILGEGTIADASPTPKTISLVGDTALSTEQAKFGTQSIKFDGAGDYLSAGAIGGWNFLHEGSGWAIDFWVRLVSTSGSLLSTATLNTQRGINILANGTINIYNGTAGQVLYSGSFTPPALNTWAHVAIVETGTNLRIYLSGSLVTTITRTNTPGTGNSNTALIVGNQATAYIDGLRITTAVRYAANFTPDTTPPPTFQRVGTYFTVPVLPGIQAAFVFDPAIGWQVPYLLPRFTIQDEGVDLAEIGQVQDLNFTGSALTASFAGSTITVNSTAIPASEKGVSNGVATLDSNGLIPASQLPTSAMEFKGTWNASTNTPTLADGTGNMGDTYRVSVAGSQNLGSGNQTYSVADWILYNGSIWQQVDNTENVASVFGRSGVISAQSGDYIASQIVVTPTGNIASVQVQAAIEELDVEKQADIQWQDDGVNQGTAGQVSTFNITGAGATLSISSETATLNIPGAGTTPTLILQEQGSAPTTGVNEAAVYVDTSQRLGYREESNGTANTIAVLGRFQTYTAAQGVAQVTLTDGPSIVFNGGLSNSFTLTLGGNRTLANPINSVAGFTYIIRIVQDATGGRTLAYGSNFKFPGGTVPTLSTAANAVDILTCYCAVTGGNLNCNLVKDFK